MRISTIAICCILLGGIAWPECVEVEGKPQEASSHVRLAVVMRGKPVKDATVNVYVHGTSQTIFESRTDEHGIVLMPKLAPKEYDVVAKFEKDLQSSLWLRVVPKHGATRLSLDLTGAEYQAHPELGLQTYMGAEEPIQQWIQTFEGTLIDPSGAAIVETKIRVLKMGEPYGKFMLPLAPDASGHFAAQLPEGRYIAYFFANGFRTEKVPFEITKEGSGNLHIALKVGSC